VQSAERLHRQGRARCRTLTTHGKTEKAYASLRPDYIVDDVVKASETGALGAGTSSPEVRGNKPPAVKIDEVRSRSVKVGQPLTLVSEVKDDGIPKPRNLARVAAAQARAAEQTTTRLLPPCDRAARLRRLPPRPPPRRRRRAIPRCFRRRGSRSARTWGCTCPGSCIAARPGDVRSPADQAVGGHARRRQLAVGAALVRADVPPDGKQPVQVTFWSPARTCSIAGPTMAHW
jgi:hypothetical protein